MIQELLGIPLATLCHSLNIIQILIFLNVKKKERYVTMLVFLHS